MVNIRARLAATLICLAAATVAPAVYAQHTWTNPGNGCLTTDAAYNQKVERFAQRVLRSFSSTVGCITNPWLYSPYGYFGLEVHAGLDLRIRNPSSSAPVVDPSNYPTAYPVWAGRVVTQSLAPESGRSTLVIETRMGDSSYRVFYLHCALHYVTLGQTVTQETPLCLTGSVGADAPHLHIEVKKEGSPDYDFGTSATNFTALTGRHCNASEACTRADIISRTIDPVDLLDIESNSAVSWTTGAYANFANIGRTLQIPGAAGLSVSVSGQTEYYYDVVYIYDRYGTQIKALSGSINETFTVVGDTITARLIADGSVTSSGVTITIRSAQVLSEARKADLMLDCIEQMYPNYFSPHQASTAYSQPSGGIAYIRVYGSNRQAVWNGNFWYDLGYWYNWGSIENLKQYCGSPW